MAHLRTVRTEQAINRCRFYSGRDVYRTSDLSCKGSNALCLLGHGLTTWSEGIVAQHECVGDGGPIFYLFGKEPISTLLVHCSADICVSSADLFHSGREKLVGVLLD